MCAVPLLCHITKRPNLESKTRPKQLLDYLPFRCHALGLLSSTFIRTIRQTTILLLKTRNYKCIKIYNICPRYLAKAEIARGHPEESLCLEARFSVISLYDLNQDPVASVSSFCAFFLYLSFYLCIFSLSLSLGIFSYLPQFLSLSVFPCIFCLFFSFSLSLSLIVYFVCLSVFFLSLFLRLSFLVYFCLSLSFSLSLSPSLVLPLSFLVYICLFLSFSLPPSISFFLSLYACMLVCFLSVRFSLSSCS
jgi:hypothetical protein